MGHTIPYPCNDRRFLDAFLGEPGTLHQADWGSLTDEQRHTLVQTSISIARFIIAGSTPRNRVQTHALRTLDACEHLAHLAVDDGDK